MDRYKQNAKWLTYFAPFRMLSVSAAYLTPFFLEKGLSLSEVFLLQSIFSLCYLLLEVPSGYFADRYGRAFSIKLSAPIAASAMVAYGFSDHFWQFVLWEVVLAVANSLISGVDTALLVDSLKADGREDEYVRLAQRMDALGYAATALSVPLAVVLVRYVGIEATLVADGVLTAVGMWFAWKLVEAPRLSGSQEAARLSAWQTVCSLGRSADVRWLVVLGSVLSLSTYLAFWLSAPYYQQLGISAVWFAAILAARNLWKAWLSHRFHRHRKVERDLAGYAVLAGLVYAAMASGQLWLVWMVLGHDAVQALHRQPVAQRLNGFFAHEHRATMNSVANLMSRLFVTVAGPAVGFLADRYGLHTAFMAAGLSCSTLALVTLARLHALRTFHERS